MTERPIEKPSGQDEVLDIATLSDEQMQALAVEILDRGITQNRFHVELPPDMHGEWVPRDALAIREMQAKGFRIDDKFAKANAQTNDGTAGNIIGDVIFMTCPQRWKNALDAERTKRFVEFHSLGKNQKEEEDYRRQAEGLKKSGIGIIEESSTQNVSGDKYNKT